MGGGFILAVLLLAASARGEPLPEARLAVIPSGATVELRPAEGQEPLPPYAWSAGLETVAFAARRGEARLLVVGESVLPVEEVRFLGFVAGGPGVVSVCREEGRDALRFGAALRARHERIKPPRFSSRGRLAFAARERGRAFVVVDDLPGPDSDAVGDPVFSPDDARLAYWRRVGQEALLWVDGEEAARIPAPPGAALMGVEDPVFSPDGRRLAFGWRRPDEKSVVVIEGVAGAPFADVGRIAFSPDGRRWLYGAARLAGADHDQLVLNGVVLEGVAAGAEFKRFARVWPYRFDPLGRPVYVAGLLSGKELAVLDGRPTAEFDSVTMPVFGPGARWALVAREGKDFYLVSDDGRLGPFEAVAEPVYAPDGRLAFAAKRSGRWSVLAGGRPLREHDQIGSLQFSDRAVAYWARDGAAWRVHVDGEPAGPSALRPGLLRLVGRLPVTTSWGADGARVGVGVRWYGPFDELGPTLVDEPAGWVYAGVRAGRELWRKRFPLK